MVLAGEYSSSSDLVISSVKYDDVNMALVEGSSQLVSGSVLKTELYYLLDANLPSTGSYVVEVIYSGNVNARCAGAISLSNVMQQPAEAVDSNSSEGYDTISTSITTLTEGAMLVDVAGCGVVGSFSPAVAGMVERFNISAISCTAAGSTKPVVSAGPAATSWTFAGANQLAHSLAAFAPATCNISGYVIEPNGVPVDGGLVSSDNGGGADITDPNGYYELIVQYGWSGTVTPAKTGYVFSPVERTYSDLTTDALDQNYEDIIIYDLDGDGSVGLGDVGIIHDNWLGNGPGDFDTDGNVDLHDFAEFALIW